MSNAIVAITVINALVFIIFLFSVKVTEATLTGETMLLKSFCPLDTSRKRKLKAIPAVIDMTAEFADKPPIIADQ